MLKYKTSISVFIEFLVKMKRKSILRQYSARHIRRFVSSALDQDLQEIRNLQSVEAQSINSLPSNDADIDAAECSSPKPESSSDNTHDIGSVTSIYKNLNVNEEHFDSGNLNSMNVNIDEDHIHTDSSMDYSLSNLSDFEAIQSDENVSEDALSEEDFENECF